ncbi:MAG: radical SAM protein [Dehalococcoidia bacterium]|nr:radical SAM protein [Dehalococcoidia bacterium]MDD5493187.1 radical SAM protein [Dehalococcoidia bacterium]
MPSKGKAPVDREVGPENEFYFQWHVTERCNRRCLHCYQSTQRTKELSTPELGKILTIMETALAKWNRRGSISFTGGEPFIRRTELIDLLEKVDKSAQFDFYDILTNGSLIDNELLILLKKASKLRRVQVSLEGSTPTTNDRLRGHGSFAETMKAIKGLKQCGFTVSVMTTVSRLNYRDISNILDLLKQEGVDTFSVERLVPEGKGKQLKDQLLTASEVRDMFELLYKLKQKSKTPRILTYRPLYCLVAPDDMHNGALCSVGNNALTIMPDGTVYPCRRLPIPIGNILEDGLFSIWYQSEVLWDIRNPANLKGKCGQCNLMTHCRGCRAVAYAVTGDYLAEDPQCWN